ncbi:ATP-binding protein [Mesorhizobium sp.]|uniref:sensor histidine kinase n=1 Tax=Mesorhizobium sp. TaxID=1871066 RepID=UPI0025DE237F|nr:ATP-binding protein [Mesorhizobium sp.]
MVEAALATYRPERSQRPMSAADLDDISLLLKPELRRKRQRLDWSVAWNGARELPIRGGPVRQAILNLLLNASAVTPEDGTVSLTAMSADDRLHIEIGDQGCGMPPDIAGILIDQDPGPAVRAGRGLGLWMVRRVVDDLGGHASIAARRGGGTAVTLTIPFDREDVKAHAA